MKADLLPSPQVVVQEIRVELTRGHLHRFFGTMRFVLISFIMKPAQ